MLSLKQSLNPWLISAGWAWNKVSFVDNLLLNSKQSLVPWHPLAEPVFLKTLLLHLNQSWTHYSKQLANSWHFCAGLETQRRSFDARFPILVTNIISDLEYAVPFTSCSTLTPMFILFLRIPDHTSAWYSPFCFTLRFSVLLLSLQNAPVYITSSVVLTFSSSLVPYSYPSSPSSPSSSLPRFNCLLYCHTLPNLLSSLSLARFCFLIFFHQNLIFDCRFLSLIYPFARPITNTSDIPAQGLKQSPTVLDNSRQTCNIV